jgi:hypothetical protein
MAVVIRYNDVIVMIGNVFLSPKVHPKQKLYEWSQQEQVNQYF